MSVKNIMLADPKYVRPEDTVPKVVQLMLDHGIRNVPVADAQGRFLGSFGTVHLLPLLLPKVATFDEEVFGGVTDLSFVHDTFEDIRDRLDEVRSHHVGDYMDRKAPTIEPDTSIIEGMLLLYKHRTHVPVVEKTTRKLVGVVTFNCVLRAIMGD